MIDPSRVPDVGADEAVARFVFSQSHIRANGTVKPNALMPHPHPDLSVNRHLMATEPETWQIGADIATQRKLKLQGRADLQVKAIHDEKLEVVPDPISGNPNHALVLQWPTDKPAQKIIATELASKATYLAWNPVAIPTPLPSPQVIPVPPTLENNLPSPQVIAVPPPNEDNMPSPQEIAEPPANEIKLMDAGSVGWLGSVLNCITTGIRRVLQRVFGNKPF